MSLTERRHLGRQEENVEETGLQVRGADPITPVNNQVWINFNQNKIKTLVGGDKVVLVDGGIGSAVEVPLNGILDATISRSFFKQASSNLEITSFLNFTEGLICYLKVSNPSVERSEIAAITIPDPLTVPSGGYFLLNSASNQDKYYVWININDDSSDPAIIGRTGIEVDITIGRTEITEITLPAASVMTSGQHWLLNSANDSFGYYVWYNIGTLGGDPLISGKVGIQVVLNSLDTPAQVALKTAQAIDALATFTASNDSNVVSVETTSVGPVTNASNVSVTGLVINVTRQGNAPDTVNSFAVKVAAAINAISGFTVPVPASSIITVTIANGFVDDPVDVNMGVLINVTQQGSGSISIEFPATALLDENTVDVVTGQKERVYKLFRSGSFVHVCDFGEYSL
jgi:hypothetical protein